ncbi:Carbonic anhydrase [Sergentomyia squamirostris]
MIVMIFFVLFAGFSQENDQDSLQPLVHIGMDYVADTEFSYDDPSKWKDKYPNCAGESQSPVNIVTNVCEVLPKIQRKVKITNADVRPETVELLNDHYTVKYLLTWPEEYTPQISGAFLGPDRYIPRDIHFHWGREDAKGSEHSINSEKYSLEMHIVCYNDKYKSVADAKFHNDGILVIAQFFQAVSYAPNYFFLDLLPRIRENRSQINIREKLCLYNLGEFLNVDSLVRGNFVTYNGSFTTPPCYEDVTWIVSLSVAPIERRKMHMFRTTQGLRGQLLVDNCRPLQAINKRKCLKN